TISTWAAPTGAHSPSRRRTPTGAWPLVQEWWDRHDQERRWQHLERHGYERPPAHGREGPSDRLLRRRRLDVPAIERAHEHGHDRDERGRKPRPRLGEQPGDGRPLWLRRGPGDCRPVGRQDRGGGLARRAVRALAVPGERGARPHIRQPGYRDDR